MRTADADTGFGLLTDLYELTMAAAYYDLHMEQQAAFELFVRDLPEGRPYLLAAGLQQVVEYLEGLRFTAEEIDYLRGLPIFERAPAEFFDRLGAFAFSGNVFAVPEGTPVFADEPLLRVEAPLPEAQVVETYLLSIVNYETLVATKAARVVAAACCDGRDRAVVDYGSRRAHGPEAGVLAARACYIAGCAGTSNVEAGFRMGIPVSGTEAHSFIMAFGDEEEAFRQYYRFYGDQSVLLIDTYDVVEGARRAIRVAPDMKGVRIDSGDLARLSRRVRGMLDDAGLDEAKVFLSSDLDEFRISELIEDGAETDGFGVGTRMVTGGDVPSLGGVYKLVAIKEDGEWTARLKLSAEKKTYPGRKQVHRFTNGDGRYDRDVIVAATEECPEGAEPLLGQVMRDGRRCVDMPHLEAVRKRAASELTRLPDGCRRLREAEPYPVEHSRVLEDRLEKHVAELEESHDG